MTSGLLAAALLLGVSTPSKAVSIDEFDGETTTTSTPFTFDAATILGGERDVNPSSNASFSSTGGAATFNLLSGIANVQIYYDGNDDDAGLGFGLGAFDLTAGGADRFLFAVTAITSNPAVAITVYDSSGNSIRSGPFTLTSTGNYEILFSSLSIVTGTGANLTGANSVQLTVSDNTASGGPGSLTLDYLRTNSAATPSVPEPSSVVLMGLGLAACGIWRRKRAS
ncbi:MAG: PEP-CTERM sorting domain-containing protein [Acidobacteria bacterium]|nr:PEP-CTERM sorting domain-containing protein [Acidobacteriota bacterium]